MRPMALTGVLLPVLLGARLAGAQPSEPPIQLTVPVQCTLGKTCEIQNYVDDDPTTGARDYRCGHQTYDAHSGVDIRLSSLAAQRAGVAVLAAADGRVLRLRDGVADASVAVTGSAAVKGVECGNGLVIGHADGWETQYCHMEKGRFRVKAGDQVKAGQAIGEVGLSGQTEFPHLHLTVRHAGVTADPFAYGAAAGSCNAGMSLWRADQRGALAYKAGAVLNAGFATVPVTSDMADQTGSDQPAPTSSSPMLVAFVRAIGLQAGDEPELTLTGPDGGVLATSRAQPLDHDKAQWLVYVGKRRPPAGWLAGRYSAQFRVHRKGAIVINRSFSVAL